VKLLYVVLLHELVVNLSYYFEVMFWHIVMLQWNYWWFFKIILCKYSALW